MLRLATRAGMAHITSVAMEAYADRVPHADGFYVPDPVRSDVVFDTLSGVIRLSLHPKYLPYCPLRLALHSLFQVRSSCPKCLWHSMYSVSATNAMEYFNFCPFCDLAYVDVCISPWIAEMLLPYLSPSHYLHGLRKNERL